MNKTVLYAIVGVGAGLAFMQYLKLQRRKAIPGIEAKQADSQILKAADYAPVLKSADYYG